MRQNTKHLSSKTVEFMCPRDRESADTGENRGLRVTYRSGGTKTFFYRYTSHVNDKLVQVKIGNFPQDRSLRHEWNCNGSRVYVGVCPATAAQIIAAETGLEHLPVGDGERVSGVYRRSVMLASGRFPMLDDGTRAT